MYFKKVDEFYNKHFLPFDRDRDSHDTIRMHSCVVFIRLIDKFIVWIIQYSKKKIALLFKKKKSNMKKKANAAIETAAGLAFIGGTMLPTL